MRRAVGNRVWIVTMILAGGAFAVWPLKAPSVRTPDIKKPEAEVKTLAAVDVAAFRVPIWVAEPAPPPPPAPVTPPPPPAPLKLQLLAIVNENGVYRAAVYDPDADKLLVVAAGEKIGSRRVEKVDKSAVTLADDTGKRVLALKQEGGGS